MRHNSSCCTIKLILFKLWLSAKCGNVRNSHVNPSATCFKSYSGNDIMITIKKHAMPLNTYSTATRVNPLAGSRNKRDNRYVTGNMAQPNSASTSEMRASSGPVDQPLR